MVFNRILAIAAVLVLATGMASADMLVTTDAATIGPNPTDFTFSLVFPSTATPAGFHLVGATLSITDLISDSNLTLANAATSSESFEFIATSDAKITSNSADSTFVGSTTSPDTVLDTTPVTFTTGETVDYAPLSLTETLGPTTVADAAAYLAGATLGGGTSSSTEFLGGGGNIDLTQNQTATINGQLVFDFAPNTTSTVPEPASIILFGTALLSLGWLRKRRTS